MLIALIRKDFRVCRLSMIAGILTFVAPFVAAAVSVTNMPLWSESTAATAWAVLLGAGCYFSIMCSQASLAMLSGTLIAAERADRSAEFLAYLPPSRWNVLRSKLIVLGICAGFVWGTNLFIGVLADWLAGDTDAVSLLTNDLAPLHRLAAIGVSAIGVGWWASARLETTGPPVTAALAAPIVVLSVLRCIQYVTGHPDELLFASTYFTSCAATGVIAFLTGCLYFLRRVEP